MSIQKRTVFYDNTGGVHRFWGWALTTTTLGVMAEPFQVSVHSPDVDFETLDPANEINRVDEMRALPFDKHQLILSGGDDHLNGGHQLPRVGP